MAKSPKKQPAALRLVVNDAAPRLCGLCDRKGKLTLTECCGNTICDDRQKYVPFSYSRDSCYRNHSNQTIYAYHQSQEHEGSWKECLRCRRDQPPEMYAWFATNEYNFEKLENPPPFKPTFCAGCKKRIVLAEGGYTRVKGKYWCEACDPQPLPPMFGSRRGGV